MKKILYIIQLPPPTYGVTVVNKLVYESTLINNNLQKELIKVNYSQSLADLKKISFKKILLMVKLWFKLFLCLVKFKPEFIYYTIPPTGIGFLKEIPNIILIKIFGKTPIFHLHGKGIQDYVNSSFKIRIYNYVFSNSIIIHLSEGLLNSEFQKLTIKNSRLFAVPNGVITSNTKNELKDDCINFLFLSNIQESKGIFLLLESFSRLIKSNLKVKLNIIGDFRDRTTELKFKQFLVDNDIESHIRCHGALYDNEKHEKIAQSDVLVHPSYNDAYPLVLLEAMQHGLAIIGSDQGAIPEIITSDIGYVFKTGDVNTLTDYMRELVIDKNKREFMQDSSRKLFRKRYTIQHFEQRMIEVFKHLS